MGEFLNQTFEWVCSQPPGRTWSLDGEWLPFCQRCTGIYVGAVVAFVLQWVLKIRSDSRLLGVYGLLLVQLVPFGLHILPDTAILRTLTGMAFGFGLVGFLWLLPQERLNFGSIPCAPVLRRYAALALLSALGLIFAITRGGTLVALALSFVGFAGFLILLLLTVINLCLLATAQRYSRDQSLQS